jgi:PhnB protein
MVKALKNYILINMTTISPWINFNGNAEEAFNFYQAVFGGEFAKVIRFKDIASSEFPVGDADANKIMQIALVIGDGQMLIGNDVPEFMGKVSESENRSKICIGVENREEAQRIFTGLSAGGQVEVSISDSAEETTFGMFRDKFGIEWVVECR